MTRMGGAQTRRQGIHDTGDTRTNDMGVAAADSVGIPGSPCPARARLFGGPSIGLAVVAAFVAPATRVLPEETQLPARKQLRRSTAAERQRRPLPDAATTILAQVRKQDRGYDEAMTAGDLAMLQEKWRAAIKAFERAETKAGRDQDHQDPPGRPSPPRDAAPLLGLFSGKPCAWQVAAPGRSSPFPAAASQQLRQGICQGSGRRIAIILGFGCGPSQDSVTARWQRWVQLSR